MAKIQSQFPVGSFYLRGGNNGKGTINIRYFIRGRYAKKSTGIEVDVKMWDNKGQKKSRDRPIQDSIIYQIRRI